jgi:Janus/Ocnus family (Ocnus)
MGMRCANIVFIDYSEWYYSVVAKTPMPEKQSAKFVQIRHYDTEYLIFSPKDLTPYHGDIVERFCRDKGVSGSFEGRQKHFAIHDISWVIVGGGKIEIDRIKKCVRLYDNSMAYGKFDPAGLKDKILQIAQMADYEVEIE